MEPLHYLSPYLPHNIEVETPRGIRTMSDQFTNDKEIVIGAVARLGYKPLLHPLSKLTEEMVDWLAANKADEFSGYHSTYNDVKKNARLWYNHIIEHRNDMPYDVVEEVFKRHGDFYDLIPEGKAIKK